MSEGDAQIARSSGSPRLGEVSRPVTRTPRTGSVDAAGTGASPSFADSLASASQFMDGDSLGADTDANDGQGAGTSASDSEVTRSSRKPGETGQTGSVASRADLEQTDSPLLAMTLDPNGANAATLQAALQASASQATSSQVATGRTPIVSAIRPEGRLLGPVPAVGSTGTAAASPATTAAQASGMSTGAAAMQAAALSLPVDAMPATTAGAAAVQPPTTTSQTIAPATQASTSAGLTASATTTAQQSQAASDAAAANQAAAAAGQAEAARLAAVRQASGMSTAAAAGQTTAASTAAYTSANTTAAFTTSAASAQTLAQTSAQSAQAGQYAAAANRAATPSPMTGVATGGGDTGVQATGAVSAASNRSTPGTASTRSAYATGGGDALDVGSGGAVGSSPRTGSAGSSSQSIGLGQYPKPERSDRTGVLNWVSDTPPDGKELDRLIGEARERKAGWVTFVANPDRTDEYGDFMDRLTRAGIQPIARVEDPYGDLPVEDVTALVKDLRGHGVKYFQLFDGPNVATETPDDKVDVKEYADRWLSAAKAVVAEGGLPGIGALAPKGDYDEHGFMRQFLSAVKDRDGTNVLGQSWLALRGDQPGATASSDDTDRLADRATWFDRVSRQALGRSLPILATQDPSGPAERLTADTRSTSQASQFEQADRTLHERQRKLPALFAASRGTLDHERP